MPSKLLCSFCKVTKGIVSCRDGCGNVICFPCVITIPTGGQCHHCFTRFKNIHLENHIKELSNKAWFDAVVRHEWNNIEEDTDKMKNLDTKKKRG